MASTTKQLKDASRFPQYFSLPAKGVISNILIHDSSLLCNNTNAFPWWGLNCCVIGKPIDVNKKVQASVKCNFHHKIIKILHVSAV
jgi:hypothetical protein